MHIVGIGVDICDSERFARVLARAPRIADRIFTTRERGEGRSAQSLAARFAAKEAVAKVLRNTAGLAWQDCEVVIGDHGAPGVALTGAAALRAGDLGVKKWHLSISHDGGLSIAFVVAEGEDATRISGG